VIFITAPRGVWIEVMRSGIVKVHDKDYRRFGTTDAAGAAWYGWRRIVVLLSVSYIAKVFIGINVLGFGFFVFRVCILILQLFYKIVHL
jgi:hypothetical protein